MRNLCLYDIVNDKRADLCEHSEYSLNTCADPEGGQAIRTLPRISMGKSFGMVKLCWTHPGLKLDTP